MPSAPSQTILTRSHDIMRCTILAILSLAALIAHAAQPPSESSPVPIRWTVETSRVQPAVFDA